MEQTPTRGGRSALRNAATSERLGSNVAYNAMIVGVSFVTSTLVAFLVPRLLGPPRYGVYQLAFQSAMIFQALATLGVPATLLRYVAEQTGSGKLETAHDITVAVLRWQSLIGAGVMLLFLTLSPWLRQFYASQPPLNLFLLSGLLLLPTMLNQSLTAVLQGLQSFRSLALITVLLAPFQVCLPVLAVVCGGGAQGLIVAGCVVVLLSTTALWTAVHRQLRLRFTGIPPLPAELRRRMLRFGWQYSADLLIWWIVWERSEVFLLGILRPSKEVALYSVAYALPYSVLSPLAKILNASALPLMAQLYGARNTPELQRVFARLTRYLTLFLTPIGVGGILLSEPIIRAVYGSAYVEATAAFRLLLLSAVVAGSVVSAAGTAVSALERQDAALKVNLALTPLNLALNFVLIPRYGVLGAALANAGVQCLGGAVFLYVIYRLLSVPYPLGVLWRVLGCCGLMALGLMPLLSRLTGLKLLILGIGWGAVLYVAALVLLRAVDREDMSYLKAAFTTALPAPMRPACLRVVSVIEAYVR